MQTSSKRETGGYCTPTADRIATEIWLRSVRKANIFEKHGQQLVQQPVLSRPFTECALLHCTAQKSCMRVFLFQPNVFPSALAHWQYKNPVTTRTTATMSDSKTCDHDALQAQQTWSTQRVIVLLLHQKLAPGIVVCIATKPFVCSIRDVKDTVMERE